MTKKYLLIARENIIGISNDEGLKALNGYVEKVFEITDEQVFSEVFEKEIKKLSHSRSTRSRAGIWNRPRGTTCLLGGIQ